MEVMPFGMRLIILWAVGNIPITAAAVLMITERIGPGIFRRMERKTGVPGMVMERVTKDMLVRKGMVRVMEISREMVQAGRIPITRIRSWHCIYRRMESRSREF